MSYAKPKFCKDCKWVSSVAFWPSGPSLFCRNPRFRTFDLVTGREVNPSCEKARDSSCGYDACGFECVPAQ
jgi:hypothetical protein